MKRAIYRVVWLAALAAAGWYGYRYYKLMPEKQTGIPVTRVQRGDVLIRAFARGELRAVRSVTLYAPNLNGTVQVTSLAPPGALAKEKDLVIEDDDSERQAALEEARLSLESVDEQIKMAKANMSVQQSEDAVTLLKTRYDVRRAELDVQRNPILDAIDAKKNILALEESKRALKQLEADIAMRQAQDGFADRRAQRAAQPRPHRRGAGRGADRPDQVPRPHHGPGFHQAEPRRLL